MSTAGEELLKPFDGLPEPERHHVASEILRRTFSTNQLDDVEMADLYAEFAETDRGLAEEGIGDYERGLASEDAE